MQISPPPPSDCFQLVRCNGPFHPDMFLCRLIGILASEPLRTTVCVLRFMSTALWYLGRQHGIYYLGRLDGGVP